MFLYGGDSWIRTNDLLRMKELHFRCAISPLAPEVRIELTITESKSGVLPLHYSGIKIWIQIVKEQVIDFSIDTRMITCIFLVVNTFFKKCCF